MSGGVKRTSNKHHCGQTQAKAGKQANVKAITRNLGKWATLLTSLAKLIAALGNLTRIIIDSIR